MEGRTIKVVYVVATLALSAVSSACGGEVARDRRANEEIQFGIWLPDEDGAMRFKATADVPNEEDQAYGWRVRVVESEHRGVTVVEVFMAEGDLGRIIGRQGRTAAAVRTLAVIAGEQHGRKVQVEFRDGPPPVA